MDLNTFFKPRSIAVIGASHKTGSLGRIFFDQLLNFGYKGDLYPVNPQASDIGGIKCYQTVELIPIVPELAVILVKKDLVSEVVEGCGKKGIKSIVVITAGFREIGGEGIKREKILLKVIKKYGMRLIGPNCMGIINSDPDIRMNASFSPTEPYSGNVGFISQSGALGVAVLEMSKIIRLGFSHFISEGNKADLKDNDFLEYLAAHNQTSVIMLYLESIEDTNRFRTITSKISRHKPLIVLKAGRSISGAKAASSHTGALSSPDRATEALFLQCGIIRAETITDMFNYALAFSNQPIPKGDKIAIITNAGGVGILATDALERYDLKIAQLSDKTKTLLRTFLPEEASVDNPVDMIASANEEAYRKTLATVLTDANVDAILVIIVHPPIDTTPEIIARGITGILSKRTEKPIFIVLMAETDELKGISIFQQSKLPVYTFPESAARSIAAMVKYQKWLKKPAGKIKKIRVDKASLVHIFEGAKADRRNFLHYEEITTLLKAYDFPLVEGKVTQSPQEAVQFYNHLKKPVALKIESDDIIHKSDSGCVRVNLENPQSITEAFNDIMNNALKISRPEKITGILVQEMIQGSTEVVLGMNRDPNYGPLIMFGMGGIFVEVFKDICFRLAPLSENDAWHMIKETQAYQILKGFRGSEAVDFTAIVSSLLKLSQLSMDWPQISELDMNPFMVAPQQNNCKIVDARIKIHLKK